MEHRSVTLKWEYSYIGIRFKISAVTKLVYEQDKNSPSLDMLQPKTKPCTEAAVSPV